MADLPSYLYLNDRDENLRQPTQEALEKAYARIAAGEWATESGRITRKHSDAPPYLALDEAVWNAMRWIQSGRR